MKNLCIFLLVSFVIGCVGWGEEGHKIVAQIANDRLSKNSLEYLKEFLDGTPYSTLADIAPLADDYDHTSDGRWSAPCHYVDLPDNAKHFEAKYCGKCCVVSAIKNYTKLLTKEANSPNVCEFGRDDEPCPLEFLVHFVGDVHQPLHVSYASDRGGNEETVYWFGDETNLHKVWDTEIIDKWDDDFSDGTSELEDLISNNPSKVKTFESNLDAAVWADESFQYVLNNVYDYNQDTGTLGESYYKESLPIVKWRLVAAGVRLAKVLNTIFDNAGKK
eukprot:TRINITY_DN360_c0_g1_i1.p1 TRINITY_DN360_c0_g1~~TRINITY_DN360_c0_g1_i1.p1  ORF type:complete len:308 (-),score=95.96 TRINITY_DN360_c0_g1_i1:1377-2201(-)